MVPRVARHEREAVRERERGVVAAEVGEKVRHRDEHREAGTPTGVAVRGAELDAGAHDLGRADAGFEQPEHRLRDHERDVVLQALPQPRLHVPDRIGVGAGADEHVAVADVGVEPAGVVGPQIERAPRHEVETGMVPVAGDEPGLDGALVEGKAEVGAAILDRVRPVVVPEHHDRQGADLGEQPAVRTELGQRSGADLGGGGDHASILSERNSLR